jgi:hypothetical protein
MTIHDLTLLAMYEVGALEVCDEPIRLNDITAHSLQDLQQTVISKTRMRNLSGVAMQVSQVDHDLCFALELCFSSSTLKTSESSNENTLDTRKPQTLSLAYVSLEKLESDVAELSRFLDRKSLKTRFRVR